jgi:hypothetical protein
MSTFKLAEKGTKCPFSAFEKDCRQLVSDEVCKNWVHLQGHNPLTGEPMSQWGCAFSLSWLFAAEAAKNGLQAQANVQTLRNMIFDPKIRAKQLAADKAAEAKLIEAKT